MSRHSPDEQPTTVLQQPTAEQPGVTAVPATRRTRIWQRRVPSRIGRARTSTVTIGCLFVLLSGLNYSLPQDPYVTVPLPDGGSVRVRSSQLSPAPTAPSTTPPSTPTTEAPASTSTSAPTTAPSRSTTPRSSTATTPPEDQQEPTTTAPQTTRGQTSEEAPSASRAPTTRAPATTAQETSAAPTS
jgi:hypothetical protein